VALREFGRIERTLFALDWLLDKNLRQRVTAGLNKGELKNTLAKAVIVQADSILWWLHQAARSRLELRSYGHHARSRCSSLGD
jgi:hypothetical protein